MKDAINHKAEANEQLRSDLAKALDQVAATPARTSEPPVKLQAMVVDVNVWVKSRSLCKSDCT